jgi:hypothetical protein
VDSSLGALSHLPSPVNERHEQDDAERHSGDQHQTAGAEVESGDGIESRGASIRGAHRVA